MYTLNLNQSLADYDTLSNMLTITLFVILMVSCLIIFMIFPIYSIVQKNRDKILSLCGTFPADKLN